MRPTDTYRKLWAQMKPMPHTTTRHIKMHTWSWKPHKMGITIFEEGQTRPAYRGSTAAQTNSRQRKSGLSHDLRNECRRILLFVPREREMQPREYRVVKDIHSMSFVPYCLLTARDEAMCYRLIGADSLWTVCVFVARRRVVEKERAVDAVHDRLISHQARTNTVLESGDILWGSIDEASKLLLGLRTVGDKRFQHPARHIYDDTTPNVFIHSM